MGPEERDTLGRFPFPVARVACRYCPRRGRYRLESLIEKYGRGAAFDEVLADLSSDCTRASDRTSRRGCRGAYFPDLMSRRDRERRGW